jgi:hypothetical protein
MGDGSESGRTRSGSAEVGVSSNDERRSTCKGTDVSHARASPAVPCPALRESPATRGNRIRTWRKAPPTLLPLAWPGRERICRRLACAVPVGTHVGRGASQCVRIGLRGSHHRPFLFPSLPFVRCWWRSVSLSGTTHNTTRPRRIPELYSLFRFTPET